MHWAGYLIFYLSNFNHTTDQLYPQSSRLIEGRIIYSMKNRPLQKILGH